MKLRVLTCILFIFSLSGCANFGKKLKAFLNGGQQQTQKKAQQSNRGPSFSSQPNYIQGQRKQYRRMTKKDLELGNQLQGDAGSLWAMEGQGAYLFSQNIMRMIGDPIAIGIEGESKEQLEAKSQVISKLLKKLAERQRLAKVRQPTGGATNVAKGGPVPKAPPEPPKQEEGKDAKSDKLFKVKQVPARIVERLIDGNYRVKGSQPFMIGQREYKTIVTGIVRAEDFSEEGISASRLIDPRFDIVSMRRKENEL